MTRPGQAFREIALYGLCGGMLIAASSTHKMTPAEFEVALADGAMSAGTRLQIVDRRGLPPDFPTVPGFPEANYLKFAVAVRG